MYIIIRDTTSTAGGPARQPPGGQNHETCAEALARARQGCDFQHAYSPEPSSLPPHPTPTPHFWNWLLPVPGSPTSSMCTSPRMWVPFPSCRSTPPISISSVASLTWKRPCSSGQMLATIWGRARQGQQGGKGFGRRDETEHRNAAQVLDKMSREADGLLGHAQGHSQAGRHGCVHFYRGITQLCVHLTLLRPSSGQAAWACQKWANICAASGVTSTSALRSLPMLRSVACSARLTCRWWGGERRLVQLQPNGLLVLAAFFFL